MFSIFSKVRNDSWVRTKLQNNWILILFLMGRTTQHNGPNPSFSSCAPARNPRMEPAAGKFGALPHTTRLLRWKRQESPLAMNRRPGPLAWPRPRPPPSRLRPSRTQLLPSPPGGSLHSRPHAQLLPTVPSGALLRPLASSSCAHRWADLPRPLARAAPAHGA